MTHLNPSVLLVWTVLSALLGVFLISHLWAFDRFKCLRWNQGSQGAFKRVMTYSYITSIPLIFIYSVGFCALKYQEGLLYIPGFGVVPKPYELWTPFHRTCILPLNIIFSFAWALEIVSHLEELMFWMYIVNSGPSHSEWFNSTYFKAWAVGSVSALLYMPLAAIFTRHDSLRNEAVIFFSGGIGSAIITIGFLPVLFKFPPFLRGLRRDGVDMATVVRLTKFHELNTFRIFFRCLFVIPLFILACDGLRPHKHINENMFATDFLATIAAVGLVVSSGITLTIFFPRSIELEIERETSHNRGIFSTRGERNLTFISQEQEMYGTYISGARGTAGVDDKDDEAISLAESVAAAPSAQWRIARPEVALSGMPSPSPPPTSMYSGGSFTQAQWQPFKLEPNRRAPDDIIGPAHAMDVENGYQNLRSQTTAAGTGTALTYGNLEQHNSKRRPRMTQMSHFVQSFRSPIDFRRQV